MNKNTKNIMLEPVDVYLGRDLKQIEKITCLGSSVAASLAGKYFFLFDKLGEKFAVYFEVNSIGAAPVMADATKIKVTIADEGATAAQVATALAAALAADASFTGTVSSGKYVTVNHTAIGYAPQGVDSVAAPTGFAFEVIQTGDTMDMMGYLEGNVSVSGLSSAPLEVSAHQTGSTPIVQLLTGAGSPELSFNLLEVTAAALKKLRRYSTGEYIPEGEGATSLVGGGLKGQFQAPMTTRAVLHPVSKDLADKSSDVAFWNVTVDIDSLEFSGESVKTLPVTIKANHAADKPRAVSVWAYGDWTQVESE